MKNGFQYLNPMQRAHVYNSRMQNELFANTDHIQLDMPAADVRLYRAWLQAQEADALLTTLYAELPWEQPQIHIAGQTHVIPRMQVWSGEPGAVLRYSGKRFTPHAWHPLVLKLKQKLEELCTTPFNSVLINLYRDGQDSVSWHADDELELGADPIIASVSLGAERTFKFKSRNKTLATQDQKNRHVILKNGDLIVMQGSTQKHWLHCVPKCDICTARRINLTFRRIVVMS